MQNRRGRGTANGAQRNNKNQYGSRFRPSQNMKNNRRNANKKRVFFVNPRIKRKALPKYRFFRFSGKDSNFLKLNRLMTNEQLTADSGIKVDDFWKKVIESFKDQKDFEMGKIKFIPKSNINFSLLKKSEQMDLKQMLSNYIILMNVPKNIQLMVAVILYYIDSKPIEVNEEDEKELLVAIDEANIFKSLTISNKYIDKVKVVIKTVYDELKKILDEPQFKELIQKVNNLFEIKSGRTYRQNWQQNFEGIIKQIEEQKIEPFINTQLKGEQYFIKDKYWRRMSVLNNYAPSELLAVLVAIHLDMEIWIANIYSGPNKFKIEKLDVLEMFQRYLNVKDTEISKIMLLDVAQLAVPNIVL
jgi:hypothetical protein